MNRFTIFAFRGFQPIDIDLSKTDFDVGDSVNLVYYFGKNVSDKSDCAKAIEEFAKHLPLGGISFWGDSNQNLLIRVWFHRDCARVDLEKLSQLRAVFPSREGDASLLLTANNPVVIRDSNSIDGEPLAKRQKFGSFTMSSSLTWVTVQFNRS